MTADEVNSLLSSNESENLEFKKAESGYSWDKLCKYIAALANEGGGKFILGVTDNIPRTVVGSQAFLNVNEIKRKLNELFRLRVEVFEVAHPNGRVIIFKIPSRPVGRPIQIDGAYLMRSGESLVPMTPDQLKTILDESEADVTAEICSGSSISDLDMHAFELFRAGIVNKSVSQPQKQRYASMAADRLLIDTGLIVNEQLTKAAILLIGNEAALRRWIPNAEVTIEYRQISNKIRYDRRENFRQAILLELDYLWEFILPYDLPISDIQKRSEINTLLRYPERSVREAILNAIVHRDYKHPESVRVRLSPDKFEVISPGTFPGMITSDTIAEEQLRRNRLLAEALEKCGRIERSGQGVDLMIAAAVRQAQQLPKFTERDQNDVQVLLFAATDEQYLPVMQAIPLDAWDYLSVNAMRTLDSIRQASHSSNVVLTSLFDSTAVEELIQQSIITAVDDRLEINSAGRMRTNQQIKALPMPDRNARKQELYNYILSSNKTGLRLVELNTYMNDLTVPQIQALLKELKADGIIRLEGRTRAGKWFPNGTQLRLALP